MTDKATDFKSEWQSPLSPGSSMTFEYFLQLELLKARRSYEQERIGHIETRAKLAFLSGRETELEVLLNEANMDRLKPFVLRSEMENKVSVMQLIIEETEAKLESELKSHDITKAWARELEDAVAYSVDEQLDGSYSFDGGWIIQEDETNPPMTVLFQAIKNSEERE